MIKEKKIILNVDPDINFLHCIDDFICQICPATADNSDYRMIVCMNFVVVSCPTYYDKNDLD